MIVPCSGCMAPIREEDSIRRGGMILCQRCAEIWEENRAEPKACKSIYITVRK